MRVLLTGAAGFIGGHVRSALLDSEHEVVSVDLLVPSAHGPSPRVEGDLHRLDVRDQDDMIRALKGVDVVCHQAAIVGTGVDAGDAPAFASHNDLGTATLLAAMHRVGCSRLVLASSMVVYGDGLYSCETHGPVRPQPRTVADLSAGAFDNRCPIGDEPVNWALVDEDAPLRPQSFYAASKLAQEHFALAWALGSGGSVTALRYHNVYGDLMPRDTPYAGVAAIFRSSLEAGQPPQVYEDGDQTRDFVHVRDVADANVKAVEERLAAFNPLNICSGNPISIGEVARTISQARSGPTPVVTGQYRAGDVRHIVANPDRATQRLGFTACVPPTTGLKEFAWAPLRPAASTGRPRVATGSSVRSATQIR